MSGYSPGSVGKINNNGNNVIMTYGWGCVDIQTRKAYHDEFEKDPLRKIK
jgi:hypothetical protein